MENTGDSKGNGSRLDIDSPLELSRLFVNSSVAAEVTRLLYLFNLL